MAAARENPKKKTPSQLWREFPLGRTLQQPVRTTTASTAVRARSTEKPKAGATPKSAASAEKPRQAPAPAPTPAEPDPLDLPGKGQGTTFADFALVIGYASGAVLLVLGIVGVTGRVRRLRRGRPAEAVVMAGSPERRDAHLPSPSMAVGVQPELELDQNQGEVDTPHELEREDYFDGLVEAPDRPVPLPAALVDSVPEYEANDGDEPEAEPADSFVEIGDAAEEPKPAPAAEEMPDIAPEPESPVVWDEPVAVPAEAVGDPVEEFESIPSAELRGEAEVTHAEETPELESPLEEPFVPAFALVSDPDEPEVEPADSFAEIGDAAEEPRPAPAAEEMPDIAPEPESPVVWDEPVAVPTEAVGDPVEEFESIPSAELRGEAEVTHAEETPELESPLEEPIVPVFALVSDPDDLEIEPADSFAEVGDRVASVLQAAMDAAERIRREAVEEAAVIRGQAEKDAATRFTQLTAEIERVNLESQARAEALREEGERYVAERLLEADAEADKVMAEAEAQAQARRAAAEDAARIEDEARRRQAILREAALALEERLRGALEGIQDVSTDLEEALIDELPNADGQRRAS